MNLEDYASIEALNFSTLKKIEVSPAWLKHCVDHPEEESDKSSFRQGRATHCATLEPERFLDDYIVQPDFAQMARDMFDGTLHKKAAQLQRDTLAAEWFEKNNRPGVEVISQDEFDIALRSAKAIRSHPVAAKLLDGAQCEHVIRWYNPDTGIECKGRVDINCGRIVDLKTTRRNNVSEILMDATRFGYHAQVAWYHDGAVIAGAIPKDALPPMGIFVNASSKTSFVDVAVLDMENTPWVLDAGRLVYKNWIYMYRGCQIANKWPGMAPAMVNWTLPDWALNEDKEDEI